MSNLFSEAQLRYFNRVPKIEKHCKECNSLFKRQPSVMGDFCSRKCYGASRRGKEKTVKVRIECLGCRSLFKTWNCRIKVGKKFCSRKCANLSKKGLAPYNKGVKSKLSGENHYNWQGGKTDKATALIHSFEYRQFRIRMFQRDKFTCKACGKKGGNMQLDHIKPRSLFPDLIFSPNNVQTLCVPCHKNTFSYLNSNMKLEDFTYVN